MSGTVRTREFDARLEEILLHETPQRAEDIRILYTPTEIVNAAQALMRQLSAEDESAEAADDESVSE